MALLEDYLDLGGNDLSSMVGFSNISACVSYAYWRHRFFGKPLIVLHVLPKMVVDVDQLMYVVVVFDCLRMTF
jgi:hypothetical protein